MIKKTPYLLFIILLSLFTASCVDRTYVPKPHGFFRIDLPQKQYVHYDSLVPFGFETPVYSQISEIEIDLYKSRKINIEFPDYRSTLHLTYIPLKNNLGDYINDTYKYVNKHIPKASNIDEKLYMNETDHVYGITFNIEGTGVASPYQFFVTDSLHHFLRGALYFSMSPKNDSLEPVIEFIKKDIDHMISTLSWK